MTETSTLASLLPQPMPEDPARRLLLFAFRRMGAFGLHDAPTAQAFVTAFGRSFQRPLTALRAFVAELSATATGPIQIAPWCCCRTTSAEAMLLGVLARAERNPEAAGLLLADIAGVRHADGVLATATLVAGAFADLGLPLLD